MHHVASLVLVFFDIVLDDSKVGKRCLLACSVQLGVVPLKRLILERACGLGAPAISSTEHGREHLERPSARRLADRELGVHEIGRAGDITRSVMRVTTMLRNFFR